MAQEPSKSSKSNKSNSPNRRGGGRGRKPKRREKPEFEQKLLDLARVTRVVKGGRRFRFRATVVIGDRKGRVGVGIAKGTDVSDSINKAVFDAKKSMVTVPFSGHTIAHDVEYKLGSAKVLLKPAIEGRGLIAGGSVRAVIELAGIRDIVSKSLGTSNKVNVARATVQALMLLKPSAVTVSTPKEEEAEESKKPSNNKTTSVKKQSVKQEKHTTKSEERPKRAPKKTEAPAKKTKSAK